MSQTSHEYFPNMSKHVPNMFLTCPKHVQNMLQTCHKHVLDTVVVIDAVMQRPLFDGEVTMTNDLNVYKFARMKPGWFYTSGPSHGG